jgi:hypothetical protein
VRAVSGEELRESGPRSLDSSLAYVPPLPHLNELSEYHWEEC